MLENKQSQFIITPHLLYNMEPREALDSYYDPFFVILMLQEGANMVELYNSIHPFNNVV